MPPAGSPPPSLAPSLAGLLSKLLLTDSGYAIIVPALVAFEVPLSALAIRHVAFTEIDFQTYIAQAQLFLDGQRDYRLIDPPGGSGPCVYPALHLYLFSALSQLTDGGKDLVPAQALSAVLMVLTLLVIASLYRHAGAPPLLLIPLVLSKRLHSIFLLRLFNDPFALFFAYAAFLLAQRNRWTLGAAVFSLALGVKMNVLLFLPALAVGLFRATGFAGLLRGFTVIAAVQGGLGVPFLLQNPSAYLGTAFDFGRQFLYVWTVNWRFVPEDVFLDRRFAAGLLATHLSLLVAFGLFKWTGLSRAPVRWIKARWSRTPGTGPMSTAEARDLLTMLFTANLIGVMFSRSLHYQFYSWYFHQLPFLLWQARLPLPVKFLLPAAIEWCWNVYPSTNISSGVLLASHLVILGGVAAIPADAERPPPSDGAAVSTIAGKPTAKQADSDMDDELEVEDLIAGGRRPSTKKVLDDVKSPAKVEEVAADDPSEGESGSEEEEEDEEDALVKTFRRRIAVRKKVAGAIGRVMPAVRRLLPLAAIALLFVLPDPHSPVSRGVYVDENALQPGQAQVYWDYFDVTYADMIAEKVERHGRLGDAASRAELVRSELASYGLRAFTQNYTYPTTLSAPPGEEADARSGINVYARSASPRIDGREAIVLSASWKSRWRGEYDPFAPQPSDHDPPAAADEQEGTVPPRRINVRGIASLLVLARYLSTQNFLSKDLIFVVSDGYLEGINAWSTAYFSGSSSSSLAASAAGGSGLDSLRYEALQDGGSTIWNALSLDYPSDSFSKLALLYEGIDGQLPNMDALNTLLKIAERVGGGVPVALYGEVEGFEPQGARREWISPLLRRVGLGWVDTQWYENGARAALHQMRHGATGQTTGAHGVFQRHHIDALTLFAVPARGPYGFYHIGRLVESYVRSLSNLLERLHHSQFLYLLISSRHFVPIGTAIVVPLLISISLTLSGLARWYEEERRAEERKQIWRVRNCVGGARGEDVSTEKVGEWETRRRFVDAILKRGEGEGETVRETEMWKQAGRPWKFAVALGGVLLASSGVVATTLWHSDAATLLSPRHPATLLLPSLPIVILGLSLRLLLPSSQRSRLAPLLGVTTRLYAGGAIAVLSTLNVSFATALSLVLLFLHFPRLHPRSSRSDGPGRNGGTEKTGWSTAITMGSTATLILSNPLTLLPALAGYDDALKVAIQAAVYDWKLLRSSTLGVACLTILPVWAGRVVEILVCL